MEDTNETNTKTSLMNKRQDELTVGDVVKLNLGAIAVMAALYGGVVGGAVGYNAFCDWRIRRTLERETRESEMMDYINKK